MEPTGPEKPASLTQCSICYIFLWSLEFPPDSYLFPALYE
jgi:hypothetical protein